MDATPPNASGRRKRTPRNPLRTLLVWGTAGSAVFAVAGIFAGQIWLENYLKSEGFRLRAEKSIGKALRAEVHLSPPQRSGTSLYMDNLEAKGLHGATTPGASHQPPARFGELHAFGLRTELDLTALWRRAWKVDSIAIQRAQIDFTPGPPAAPPGDATASASATPVEPPPASLLARLLPNRTEIAAIRVERADITRAENQLRQARILATPAGSEGEWTVSIEDGEWRAASVPSLEPVQVQAARLLIKKDSTVLRDAKLLLRPGGHAELTGEWQKSGASEIRAKLQGVPIQPFLTNWWRAHLVGAVDGDLRLQQSGTTPARWEASLSLQNGRLEALPILSELDLFLGSPRFRSVPLRSASAKIIHSEKGTELQGLKMDADGQLRVEGNLLLHKGQVEGMLQLGLNTSLVKWLPAAKSKVFTGERDGCLWTPLHISGPVDQPVEDLTKRLAAAVAGTVLDKVIEVIPSGKKPADPNSPNDPASAKDPNPLVAPVKNALDAVKSLLPGK